MCSTKIYEIMIDSICDTTDPCLKDTVNRFKNTIIDIIIAFGFLTCPQFSSKLPGTESIERNVDTIIEMQTLQFVQLLCLKEVELCKTVHYCHLNFCKVANSRFL